MSPRPSILPMDLTKLGGGAGSNATLFLPHGTTYLHLHLQRCGNVHSSLRSRNESPPNVSCDDTVSTLSHALVPPYPPTFPARVSPVKAPVL